MGETEHDLPVEAADEGPASSPAGSSMMDQLRRKHKELADAKTIDMSIPGYDGALVARYRLLDMKKELGPIQTKVQHEFKTLPEVMLYTSIDSLIVACEGFFYFDGVDKRPLEEGIGDGLGPVKYDERLATFLGIQTESARNTVLQVFGGNEIAITEHYRKIAMWMQGDSRGVMDEFVGGLS
jgi:hypothetical protein